MSWDFATLAEELGIEGQIHGQQLRGLCPLHDDRTPSFSLNIETGMWTCYNGCGPRSGRSFVLLVTLVRDCSFSEAFAWMRGGEREKPVEDLTTQIMNRLNPPPAPDGPAALGDIEQYYMSCSTKMMPVSFLRRDFSWKTIGDWQISYDVGADAVVIPYFDLAGELGGIIQRFMNPGPNQSRYRYNDAWRKHEALFGLPKCEPGAIILTEGALDAIYLHQRGYPAAAILGSSLSAEQAILLQARGITKVYLGFDNDKAGWEAVGNSFKTLVETGTPAASIRWIRWPGGYKDVNSTVEGKFLTDEQLSAVVAEATIIL